MTWTESEWSQRCWIFQLTSSRRGWRYWHFWYTDCICISTHILTKRMTDGIRVVTTMLNISTHILTKRMTFSSKEEKQSIRYFNSHPHEEDDLTPSLNHSHFVYFNSHPHEEDDDTSVSFNSANRIFQLTSSRRGWLRLQQCSSHTSKFQLTSSRRGWR